MRLTYSFESPRSGKRCKFQLSDSRCPRCWDKIVQIRVVLFLFSKTRIFLLETLSSSFLSIYLFIYLFIYSFVSSLFGWIEEESRQNFLRLKILRGRKQFLQQRFEDDLYVYVVESSRLSQVYVHSIFRCIFYLFCWWKHRWKCVGNISSPKSEKLFQQT